MRGVVPLEMIIFIDLSVEGDRPGPEVDPASGRDSLLHKISYYLVYNNTPRKTRIETLVILSFKKLEEIESVLFMLG